MSLQRIVNGAESIQFNRRKVVGVQYTRSEVALRNETVTKNPWRLNVTFPAYLPYANNRDLIEAIDLLDSKTSETITFSNMTWMLAYQGAMTANQRIGLAVSSFVGNQLVLTGLPEVNNNFPATSVMFKAGDFIQIVGKPYPFTVTQTVLRGNDSTVTLTVHRPNFISTNVAGLAVNIGNDVQFKLFCPNMPTYTVIPGRYIVFDSNFSLYEDLGGA